MKIRVSTYWKCQLIGWTLFSIVAAAFAVLNEPFDYILSFVLPVSIKLTLFGILSSHLMKKLIKKLHVLQKSVSRQIFYFFSITTLFSVLFIVIFNLIVDASKGLEFLSELLRLKSSALNIFFFQGIFFFGAFLIWNLIYFIFHYIQKGKKDERLKVLHEKELLELEAKALRAQMNPHFIFNSLNSIKSLINKNENDKAANYLTTFSKLIRTLFQNSDKREVSLFEEIETCKLYTELETMRFGDNIEFIFNVDEKIDLKDIKVPALILQPLIENAIWHGLVPKESGGRIIFSVKETDGTVACIIDDDGIGRELSNQYKAQYRATHQSKGIGMTQSRLELDKLLNEREDTIRIIDKKSESGTATGTKVIITFKENEN